jgi:hypothetical protein
MAFGGKRLFFFLNNNNYYVVFLNDLTKLIGVDSMTCILVKILLDVTWPSIYVIAHC